jgi:phage-related tail protein
VSRERKTPIPRAVTPADPVLETQLAKLRAQAADGALGPDAQAFDWATRTLDLIETQAADQRAVNAAQAAELAEVRPIVAAVKRAKNVAWASAGGALISIVTAVWFAIGKSSEYGDARGEARATARAREEQRLEDRAALLELAREHQALARELANVRGRLEAADARRYSAPSIRSQRGIGRDPDDQE